MQSELNPLDLMNILDVLKNHELYQERLKGIQEATQTLNDGKFVKATVEQANAIMEASKVSKEKAEKEIADLRSQLNKDNHIQEIRFRQERENLTKQRQEVNLAKEEITKEVALLTKKRNQLDDEHLQLRELRDRLGKEYNEVSARRHDYTQRIKEIESIINRQFVAPNT